jgi:hypothetical protein
MRFDKRLSYEIFNREEGLSQQEFRRAYCEKVGISLPETSSSCLTRFWRAQFAPSSREVRGYIDSLKRIGHVQTAGNNGNHRLSPEGRGYLFNVLKHD